LVFCQLALLANAFTEVEYQSSFGAWMRSFQKSYGAEEFQPRYLAFKDNMDFVEKWNSEGHSSEVGLNKFADLTNEEYRSIYLGTKVDEAKMIRRLAVAAALPQPNIVNAPVSIDWRTNGSVTPVKDQGQCGSCWSFSTTGSVEGQHQLKTGNLVSLSEQNLMDCSTAQGNQGCNGGLMDDAFKYIISNNGIDTEASYPYTEKDGTCHYSAANRGATISSYKDVTAGSEAALLDASATVGPISVAIDASKASFQLYTKGVYHALLCSATRLDHGVLVVGYGVDSDNNDAYWLVKNSWGGDWGQQGYIWMSRNRNNNCGIATSASYPIV